MPPAHRPCRRLLVVALIGMGVLAVTPVGAQETLTERIAAAAVELPADAGAWPALDAAIGDARIVFLGEPWHGDGGAIAERTRLVRYLHERHDFDVLVFEGDFYALHRGWETARQTGRAGEMAAANLYSFWSQTEAARPLWAYIDAQLAGDDPLIVAGIDTKVVGEETQRRLPDDLRFQLAAIDGVSENEAARAADTLRRLLSPQPGDAETTEPDFADLVHRVDQLAEALEDDAADPFWVQNAQSLRRMLSGESRDAGMAENLIWLATHLYSGHRIIVWSHNNHALTDKWALYDSPAPEAEAVFGSEAADSVGRRTYLGEAVRHYFGDRAVYSIATLSHEGSYSPDIQPALIGQLADFDVTAPLAPTAEGSLEAAMAGTGYDIAFVDLRPFRGDPGLITSRVLDYSQLGALPLYLQRGFDGVLFLRRTRGLNEDAPPQP